MADPSDALAQSIAALRLDYAARLPARIAEIEQRCEALFAARLPAADLEELVRTVHGIAGSGAIFGMAAVSESARELEVFLESIRSGGAGAAAQERVAALIAALRQAAG